jgi:hypothetical protein
MQSAADQLIHTTVRIETSSANGDGSGTGFFFHFCRDDKRNVPVIVSNRHVIDGATTGLIHITLRKPGKQEPDLGKHVAVPIKNFESLWVKHPDPHVDLAVFPIAQVLQLLQDQGQEAYYIPFEMSLVAEPTFMSSLSAVEDIVMVGYPTGLWDFAHNLPIVRRGITATAPYVDFTGQPFFMIDCACFPGSSGSPVFLYNVGMHIDKQGNTNLGATRVKLLGILFAGPQFTAQGEIKVLPVPTASQPVALSRIPTNLGLCVKADQLKWFETHFQQIVAVEGLPLSAG